MSATWNDIAAIVRLRIRGAGGRHRGAAGDGGAGTVVVTGQEGGAVYQSLSDVRCGCCVLVHLFRMAVCVWLAVYGSLFLIHYSITLGDLLLNAV